MDLEHCTTCEGSHPAPIDEECPFTARRAPTTRRVTRQTRRTPSLSPPPPPKRGRGGRRGRGRGGRTAHQHDDSPASPDAARNQPDPPQTPEPPAPRAPSMQPLVVIQPADTQAAAIQAISDQLARMQQEARDFQAAAARDRESDRQEMIRRTTTARPTAAGPSQQARAHHIQDLAPGSSLTPPRGYHTRQPTSDFLLNRPPHTLQGYCAPTVPQKRLASQGLQLHLRPRRPSPPDPPTYCQTERKYSQTSAHPSLPYLPTQPGRSNSDVPDWTPTSCSRWQTRP